MHIRSALNRPSGTPASAGRSSRVWWVALVFMGITAALAWGRAAHAEAATAPEVAQAQVPVKAKGVKVKGISKRKTAAAEEAVAAEEAAAVEEAAVLVAQNATAPESPEPLPPDPAAEAVPAEGDAAAAAGSEGAPAGADSAPIEGAPDPAEDAPAAADPMPAPEAPPDGATPPAAAGPATPAPPLKPALPKASPRPAGPGGRPVPPVPRGAGLDKGARPRPMPIKLPGGEVSGGPGLPPAGGETPFTAPGGAPTTPANEFRPSDGNTQSKEYTLNFENADLMNVVKTLGAMTGKVYDIDPQVAQQKGVTVVAFEPMPPELAYYALESILALRQFQLVKTLDGKMIQVRPAGGPQGVEKRPVHIGTELPKGYEEYVTYIVPVQYADVTELSSLLTRVGSGNAQVDAYGPTNTLIISDTADGVKSMLNLLKQIDVPDVDTQMEIFMLEYTRAEMLATQLQEVLMGQAEGGRAATPGGAAARPQPSMPAQRPQRPQVPGQTNPTVIGRREDVLRIVSDERLNALVVIATEPLMERVRDLINKLDTPTPYEANNMHIYELLHADAEKVEGALGTILGTAPREGAQQGGAAAGGEIQPFEKKVLVSKYEQTNALLIVASPQDYKVIRELIAQMDVPQRQVHIEAVIMTVGITDGPYTLSISSAAINGLEDEKAVFGLSNVVGMANVLSGDPLGLITSAGTTGEGVVGVIDGYTTVTTAATTAEDGTVTPGSTYQVPNVPLLLKALHLITSYDTLARPSLTALDNEEASFTVGSEVPVPVSEKPTATSGSWTYSNRVERKDVGVKMKVKPQINEGDYVALEMEIEDSKPGSTSDDYSQTYGQTFEKSLINNKLIIKSGCTGIMAGLIRADTTRSKQQVPFLGEVPVLGWFLSQRSSERSKRNLVILVTPHIVKERSDIERITQSKIEDFNAANVDVLFEKNFITRIRKGHQMRNKYSPSAEYGRALAEGQAGGFQSGDVKR